MNLTFIQGTIWYRPHCQQKQVSSTLPPYHCAIMTNPPLNLHLHEIIPQCFTATDGSVYSSSVEVRLCGDLPNTPAFWAYNSLQLMAIEGTLYSLRQIPLFYKGISPS